MFVFAEAKRRIGDENLKFQFLIPAKLRVAKFSLQKVQESASVNVFFLYSFCRAKPGLQSFETQPFPEKTS